MAREEKIALDKVEVVFVHEGERYQVATPWKHEHPALLINYEMAFSCLRNTEKGSLASPHWEKIIRTLSHLTSKRVTFVKYAKPKRSAVLVIPPLLPCMLF